MEEGNSATLTATINSTDITDKTVTWKSEDEKIAKVENGKVFTIEGNSKDEVREKSYNLSSKSIYGYGV